MKWEGPFRVRLPDEGSRVAFVAVARKFTHVLYIADRGVYIRKFPNNAAPSTKYLDPPIKPSDAAQAMLEDPTNLGVSEAARSVLKEILKNG